ncbi:hypothetical protein MNBD_GAMMA18-2156 [hydrothermal vent metagenome]|uniref:Uncharacterized protein n=1 Tax=hydrothermal vent metagenome TaxID=652676 RepID=A0A3B0Z5B7_9ZZZZ
MTHKKKTEEVNKLIEKKHCHSKFIATKENRKKVKESFDKSRERSMEGKFDGIVEV